MHRHATVWPWQPAAIDQQPQAAGLVMEGLQQFDTGLAVAHAVVQQQAVFGVEAAKEVHAAEGVVFVRCQLSRGDWRVDPPLGIGGQQHALFLGAAQLPAAKRNQARQQRKHHQGRYPTWAKRPHGRLAILIHITASPGVAPCSRPRLS